LSAGCAGGAQGAAHQDDACEQQEAESAEHHTGPPEGREQHPGDCGSDGASGEDREDVDGVEPSPDRRGRREDACLVGYLTAGRPVAEKVAAHSEGDQ
jgi:hypothetical protein